MKFGEALEILKRGGMVALPEWKGYWFKENGIIKVKLETGVVVNTPHYDKYIFRNDWMEYISNENKPLNNLAFYWIKRNVDSEWEIGRYWKTNFQITTGENISLKMIENNGGMIDYCVIVRDIKNG